MGDAPREALGEPVRRSRHCGLRLRSSRLARAEQAVEGKPVGERSQRRRRQISGSSPATARERRAQIARGWRGSAAARPATTRRGRARRQALEREAEEVVVRRRAAPRRDRRGRHGSDAVARPRFRDVDASASRAATRASRGRGPPTP